MTGVEILSTEYVYARLIPFWVMFILAGVAIISLLIIIVGGESTPDIVGNICFVGFVLGVLGMFICMLLASIDNTNIIEETRYKVTISDEVNFNEFSEHYEIIDQDGKIYTVEEKE